MALAAVVLSVGFAACSSDDDDNNGGSKPNPTEKSSYMQLKFNFSEDFLSIFDVTLSYTDADGSTKTETITNKEYSKNVTYAKTPSTISYEVKPTVKANYPTKDTYAISYSYEATLVKNGSTKSGGNSGSTSVKGDNVAEFIKLYGGKKLFGDSK